LQQTLKIALFYKKGTFGMKKGVHPLDPPMNAARNYSPKMVFDSALSQFYSKRLKLENVYTGSI
jgi:hypothetical protein